MAGTVIADNLQAAATSQLVIKNGVASTPPTIQDSAGTTIGTFCRAWVNFNGSGTVAIRGSFNVSSITDNGTGDFTVNFTTAMPDANYSATTLGSDTSNDTRNPGYSFISMSTSAYRFLVGATSSNLAIDRPYVFVSIFR